MIKLVSFKICPFVQRVTAALEAKNIAYEIEYIELKNKPQWFLDISPNGQVPVMVTETGTALFESDAIIEYINDEYGFIEEHLSNEQKALNRAWSYLGAKHYLVQCGAMSSKNRDTLDTRSKKLSAAFEKIELQLSENNNFFQSDRISSVDIAWLPLLHRAAIIKQETGYDFLCGLPKTQKWQETILSLDFLNNTVSHDFVSLFKNFYLRNTYLAQGKDIVKAEGCGTSSCCG